MYSEDEWNKWISDYLKELKAVYDNSPKRIKEDYGNEAKVSSDYKGRAILEILQNADDAQVPERERTERSGNPEMYFVLKENILYCANGGYQISKDGLDSICRLSHSPKEVKNKKRITIGEKGLGFKSVLSFSENPEIHSGNLHCSFSRKKSYQFISKSLQFDKIVDKVSERYVPLLRVPNSIPLKNWKKDKTLTNLLKNYTTVLKLPFNKGLKAKEIENEFEQVDSTILLFLRYLEKINIQWLNGTKNSYTINRGRHLGIDKNTKKIQCIIQSDDIKTDWTLIQHFGEVTADKLVDLGEGWEEMDTYYVSFALQKEKKYYTPLSHGIKNRIRVYFPTKEDFYIPVLFHATFFTDISRKTINPIIPYNSYLVTEGVKVFLKYIMKLIHSENKKDLGHHIDFFTTNIQPEDLINEKVDDNVGKKFMWELFQEIKSSQIIPGFDGKLHPINDIQILNRPREEWNDWYRILGPKICKDLSLIHLCCIDENRFQIINYLNPTRIKNEDLVEILNEVPERLKTIEWCVDVYLRLSNILTDERYSWIKNRLEEKYGKLNIIKLSDGTIAAGDGEFKVFMPPGYSTNLKPPDWLKIKFVHPDIIEHLQKKTKEKRRDKILSDYLDNFKVKQYRGREVVRECVTKDLNNYWSGEDTEVNPRELLFFLFNLQKDELRPDEVSESQLKRYLIKIPVPSKDTENNLIWSPAGDIYASSDWTGNCILEKLYSFDKKSRFLIGKDYFKNETDQWEIFLKWLGVSWTPRLIRLNTPMDYYKIPTPTINQNLANWSIYASIIEKMKYEDGESTLDDGRIELCEDYVFDRFFEICEDSTRQRILLNLLANNPSLIDNIPKAKIKFIPHKKKTPQSETLDKSYQEWCLKNTNWLFAHGCSKKFKPSDLCINVTGLYNVLGDYARYINFKTEINTAKWSDMKGLLIRIGITDSLEDFSLLQWYSLLMNIKNDNMKINENLAQKIRGIYRRLIRTPLNPETKYEIEAKREFIENGKILVSNSDGYSFVSPSEAYYVDKLDLLSMFKDYVNCFQVETKRNKRVRELFDITPLSDIVVIDPDFGRLDKEIFESINRFFENSKPYLLARVRSERAIKTDSSRLFLTEIRPVRKINVRYGLKNNDNTNWVYDGETDSLLYQEDKSRKRLIYLNARLIQNSIETSEDYRNEHLLIQEISERITELLDINLPEAFQLLLSRGENDRIYLLKKSGITKEIIEESKVEIKHPEEKTTDETSDEPSTPGEIDHTKTGIEIAVPKHEKNKKIKKRNIWGSDIKESFNPVIINPPKSRKKKAKGGGGSGGYTSHQPDPEIRKKTDLAGMNIVKNHERKRGYNPKDVSTQQERLARRDSPGCDIHSFDNDGKFICKIEVKSSLGEYNKIEFTKKEWETARNKYTGKTFFLYRVSKLDADKYPDGPELLIIKDPYGQGLEAIPSGYSIRIDPRKGSLFKLDPAIYNPNHTINDHES